ncbi:hypothetical protein PSQ39_20705 [Curvibacter sp. HBC28]|uniref:DUF2946 domain-containing protein n=1 Tax=Curvibacter microcysteis TaxID=3026419 RepID=A0ABT5MPB1_9BURK|nr:DUF2946 family protein [Curvibacter sp. HBC28]MDD0817066.1 hypothetical protein [Curvibacter sp. HBC28]
MQTLRSLRTIVQLMLACFVLSLGVAVASPLVAPQSMELVCSTAGAVKLLVKAEDGVQEQRGHTLDCPLCAALGAPIDVPNVALPLVQPLGHVLQSIPAARIAALTAAPLPPRGPPLNA